VQTIHTVIKQQMETQEVTRQAQLQVAEVNQQALIKAQRDHLTELFASMQTGKPVDSITTVAVNNISPLSTQTTESSAKRSPEETHEHHINKKTKSGQSPIPPHHPAGTSHSPSNMAEETRGRPP
jgi:hypothetical protein